MKKNKLTKYCKYCRTEKNLTIDHKIPKSIMRGDADNPKNLQTLCKNCNQMKGSMTDGTVKALFRWLYYINDSRAKRGVKPIQFKQYKGYEFFRIYELGKKNYFNLDKE